MTREGSYEQHFEAGQPVVVNDPDSSYQGESGVVDYLWGLYEVCVKTDGFGRIIFRNEQLQLATSSPQAPQAQPARLAPLTAMRSSSFG